MSATGAALFILAITLGCLVRDVEVSVYGTKHAGSTLAGIRTTCTNEGEEVKIDGQVKDVSCFKCICNNGYVECLHEPCLSSQGCYLMMGRERDGCCRKCKGCIHNGKIFAHNDEWADPDDPCKVYSCVAGIVTESELQCYTPCRQPLPPLNGQCCPTCSGCQFNGLLMEDRDVTIPEDPCLTCQCTQGRMTCSKRACPVLQCDKSKAVRPPGQCCYNCPGSRFWMDPPKGNCILGKEIHKTGQLTIRTDECARCECINGTSLCRRQTCPVLECGVDRQQTHLGECCPRCPVEKPVRSYCFDERNRYEEGESWKRDACTSCVCIKGQVRCAISKCPQLGPCKHNQRLQHRTGDCCARCVENDGVCTVFGDPHYRTFDGKLFSFQGPCKYQLTADCVDKTFSIRVTNDARQTKTSAWTKTVSIKMGDVKVNLGQRLRVKVNGQRVEVPYALRGQLQVNRTEDGVFVTTRLGINVLWDGNSFVEVTAPPSYKGKLCGLCGNYNFVSRDDMTLRNGRLATSAEKFGASWRVGVRRACSRGPRPDLALPPGRDPICPHPHRRLLDNRRCKPLKGEPFAACHHKLSLNIYFRSCQMDMCECPNGLCYCESFFAYARECARLGVDLGDWREATGCLGPWQRAGQRPAISSRSPST